MNRIAKRRRDDALQRIVDYEIALSIAIAPHTERGQGVRRVSAELANLKRRVMSQEKSSQDVADLDFHRNLLELNRRRRKRKEAV